MTEKIAKSDKEWREQLGDLAFKVTRRKGTERAFTHDNFPKGSATYHCICCDTPLFRSDHKFDSGTGWPSFFKPLTESAVEDRDDRSLFMRRTETVCATCDAHLGHVFPDGPDPTGLRYCMNGVALRHVPDDEG